MKKLFLLLSGISLLLCIGLAGSSDNGNGSDLYPLLSCVFVLLFGLFSALSGAIVLQQHCVYFTNKGDAYDFIVSVGYEVTPSWYKCGNVYTFDSWTVFVVSEQEALMHKNDTSFLNHVLVNLGLKSE